MEWRLRALETQENACKFDYFSSVHSRSYHARVLFQHVRLPPPASRRDLITKVALQQTRHSGLTVTSVLEEFVLMI